MNKTLHKIRETNKPGENRALQTQLEMYMTVNPSSKFISKKVVSPRLVKKRNTLNSSINA
jgi:hypothetical protein